MAAPPPLAPVNTLLPRAHAVSQNEKSTPPALRPLGQPSDPRRNALKRLPLQRRGRVQRQPGKPAHLARDRIPAAFHPVPYSGAGFLLHRVPHNTSPPPQHLCPLGSD